MESRPEPGADAAPGGRDAQDEPEAGEAVADASGEPDPVLSDRDRAVLALARRTWHRPGAKERAIREQLEMSPTRYYQLLNALLDTPAALAQDPVTVNRLRRMREARRNRR